MKNFQFSRYIKKWLPVIFIVCLCLTAGVYCFFSWEQSYTASAVIHYDSDNAQDGYTPAGTELNVNEIKSSAIISKVINNLELENYSVDSLISRVRITEVLDPDELARKEALLEEGQEYSYKPTTFIVSFTADHSEGEQFARSVLDEILDLYFTEYSEKYISGAPITNAIGGIDTTNFDYIEMMELIDSGISDTLTALYDRVGYEPNFRAASTGMSFGDFAREFEFIQSVEVSGLFSDILEHQITKNKALLISDYNERINSYAINSLVDDEQIEDVLSIIDDYVLKMRESGNTNITFEYILEEVYNKQWVDEDGNALGDGEQTVTYDQLIYSWRDHMDSKEYATIDSAYCNYILHIFGECTGACTGAGVSPIDISMEEIDEIIDETVGDAGTITETLPQEEIASETTQESQTSATTACALSDLTCSALNDPEYPTILSEVQSRIQSLTEQLESLYLSLEQTNTEYNEYLGASNISTLSTVAVTKNVNVALYTAIAAIFFLIVCTCGAVLIGRINDIVRYIFYTDHMTGLNNRTAFDNYLKQHDHRILDNGIACVTVTITNQVTINRRNGREVGDKVLQLFAEQFQTVFGKMETYFVYNGNAQFILVVEKTDYATVCQIMEHFRLILDRREEAQECEILYEIGISETTQHEIYNIRKLLSKAFSLQQKYVSEPLTQEQEVM